MYEQLWELRTYKLNLFLKTRFSNEDNNSNHSLILETADISNFIVVIIKSVTSIVA